LKNKITIILIILVLSISSMGSNSIDLTEEAAFETTSNLESLFSLPVVHFRVNTNCRSGPGIKYPYLGAALATETYEIVGRSDKKSEYIIIYEPVYGIECWVWLKYATVFGDISDLPIFEVPPIPLASISGFVWLENCHEVFDNDLDCLVLGLERYAEGDGIYKNESRLANIEVDLYSGPCANRDLISTSKTNDKGVYIFQSLEAGTYCIGLEASNHGNKNALSHGEFGGVFSYPRRNQDFQFYEFTMLPGISYYGLNFAWDEWER
jgi:hypothetical protein